MIPNLHAVDCFHDKVGKAIIFLSHIHTGMALTLMFCSFADHLRGLSDGGGGTIFCTAVTKQLLLQRFLLPPG